MEKNRKTIKEILNAYVATAQAPSHSKLLEWIRRYPEYEQQLTDFTISWSLMTSLPPAKAAEEVKENVLVSRAMNIAWSRLQHSAKEPERKPESSMDGLLAEGRQLGLSISRVAEICQLGVTIVRKLDLRLVAYKSIPHRLIERLAHAIGRSDEVIRDYLQLPMRLPTGAEYRSQSSPQLAAEPEDFFEAIRLDPTIKQEWRSFWLSSAPEDSQG
jgi:hypothetical protein